MDNIPKIVIDNIVPLTGAVMVILFVLPYIWMHNRHSKKVKGRQKEAENFGLREPVSLHPKVNRDICIGSGACIKACPEKEILGTIHGKAETVFASRCVGHGACARACPVGAIELVFGTEKRGVDIPQVFPNFETNVPRIFIAGELGGMGLIRNAMLQGQEAVQYIAEDLKELGSSKKPDVYDLIIVGAGPAGLAASLQAKASNLKYITLDQESSFGGAILSYPRAKIVMTSSVKVPLYGNVKLKEMSKESLLDVWNDIVDKTGIVVDGGEKVEEAKSVDGNFIVKTNKRTLKTRFLLLSIGRRGSPRKLDVPGEKLPKVMYRLLEPEKFQDNKIIVVGGGDSAVEAAVALGSQSGNQVGLSYRKESFARIKEGNRTRLNEAVKTGKVKLVMSSNIIEIKKESVVLEQGGKTSELPNDYVFIFAGGELPNDFLRKVGIEIETKFGTR